MADSVIPFSVVSGGRSTEDSQADVEERIRSLHQASYVSVDPLENDYNEISIELDEREKILWCLHRHTERPIFTPGLLRDLGTFQERLKSKYLPSGSAPMAPPFNYLVWASDVPGIFNLGGDLRLIVELVGRRDREALYKYGKACIDVCYLSSEKLGLPVVTVALIQGEALGGGFEAALSSDVIIAEETARCGLPEILFNLFPGMGAYSFLARRVGPVLAEKVIFSGKIYTAPELHEMGIVDKVVKAGEGREALYEYVSRNNRQFTSRRALYKVRRRYSPVDYQEMTDIMDIWVDAALELDDTSLRKMDRLVRAQNKRRETTLGSSSAENISS
ncbi:MAG: crotonase/enoyl-CoA hydratase family protein [Rhodospirillaceae bacterium]|nr:crotonase/enoyl-CoA hydratase family protein [Rhodospirillaceae bacterium]MBT5674616.1 crotonase/enoyl-CoA hydratase family protein [Rhodospirillaceae bacterium]MBT5781157.1 crotonase/enoyl-CoA hydratase family protein [Rhodospirillaceae bacterium]